MQTMNTAPEHVDVSLRIQN